MFEHLPILTTKTGAPAPTVAPTSPVAAPVMTAAPVVAHVVDGNWVQKPILLLHHIIDINGQLFYLF